MSDLKSGKRRRAGHPTSVDDESILAYMTARIAQGQSISALVREGLSILGYRANVEGRLVLTELGRIEPAALEKRYRRLLEKLDEMFGEAGSLLANGVVGAACAQAPMRPLSYSHDKTLKRGQPRFSAAQEFDGATAQERRGVGQRQSHARGLSCGKRAKGLAQRAEVRLVREGGGRRKRRDRVSDLPRPGRVWGHEQRARRLCRRRPIAAYRGLEQTLRPQQSVRPD